MKSIFSIELDKDGNGHGDIRLTIAPLNEVFEMDSYYFAHSDNSPRLSAQIRRLLEEWKEAVISMKERDTLYLIIDFSDQYFGGLKCELHNDTLNLTYGVIRNSTKLNYDNVIHDLKGCEFQAYQIFNVNQTIFLGSIDLNIMNFL